MSDDPSNSTGMNIDEVGPWSEVKQEILVKYAAAYSRILSARKNPSFYHVYIDGFSGRGILFSKTRQEIIPGSPLNALSIDPPFREYHFVDLSSDKVSDLKEFIGPNPNVTIHEGDCNVVLPTVVYPQVRYEQYRRGLCLLDPYRLNLKWEVVLSAGDTGAIDLFLNFPIHDMNRSVLRKDANKVKESSAKRMTAFWGDETWWDVAYSGQGNLFGPPEKGTNEQLIRGYCQRLKRVAGFNYVAEPLPMRNSKRSVVYYLVFASPRPVAKNIVNNIFKGYR